MISQILLEVLSTLAPRTRRKHPVLTYRKDKPARYYLSVRVFLVGSDVKNRLFVNCYGE